MLASCPFLCPQARGGLAERLGKQIRACGTRFVVGPPQTQNMINVRGGARCSRAVRQSLCTHGGRRQHVAGSVVKGIKTRASQQQAQPLEPTAVGGGDGGKPMRVVILGGGGRVGGSTAAALVDVASREGRSVEVVIAGRSRGRAAASMERCGSTEFRECDISSQAAVEDAIRGSDLVVHCAGPFQRCPHLNVLQAAINTKTAYMDVCDDTAFSQRARSLHGEAVAAGIPAITCAGIYPGVSNVMAAQLIDAAAAPPTRLRFSYYTAGSGGAGPTILATSFLLLGEEVTAFRQGRAIRVPPYSAGRVVDFGKGVGKKRVYILSLPEVASAYTILGVPSVSARFGTDPVFWNWAMQAVAALAPKEFLEDPSKVGTLVSLTDPLVRLIDRVVGEKVSMRVDLETEDGKKAAAVFTHKFLSKSVGYCTAAFALAVLDGSTQHGVWFPEEEGCLSVEARRVLLGRASDGCSNLLINRSPWMIEQKPLELGFGIYID